jgi:outer membrane protein TolC
MLCCAFAALFTATPGCLLYQNYYTQPLTPAGVKQQLDVRTEDIEKIQPIAWNAQFLPQPDGVQFADGISPDEAAYVAVQVNPGLRTIRDQRGLAVAQVIQAGILPNPQFGFNSDSPSFGATAGTVTADTETLSWDVSKLYPLRAKIQSAVVAADSVDLEIAWQEWLVAQSARQAVFDLFAVRQQIAKLEEAEKVLRDNLKLVQKAAKEGNLTLVELSAAASATATIRTSVLAAVQTERRQRLQLNRVLGLPAGVLVELQNNISLPTGGSPPDESELYPLLDVRLDLESLRRGYESQDRAFRAAVAAQIPTTNLAVTRARDTGNVGTWGAGLVIDVPLFNRNQGFVALERAKRNKMYDHYTQSVFEGRSDIALAVAKLRVVEEQIDATQKAVASLNELVKTYNEVVRAGSGNVLVYYQAFNNLAQSRVQLIQLQQQFIDAWITLEIAVGQQISIPQTELPEVLPTTPGELQAVPLDPTNEAERQP